LPGKDSEACRGCASGTVAISGQSAYKDKGQFGFSKGRFFHNNKDNHDFFSFMEVFPGGRF
jgi:hypothetical protein